MARSDLASSLPDFITLAEATIARRLHSRLDVRRTTLVITNGEETVTLPTDLETLTAASHTDDYEEDIILTSPERVEYERRMYGVTGRPRWAAVVGDELVVAPTPDVDYTLRIVYDQRLTNLGSAGTSTNTLLATAPDVYLYGALLEAAPYLADDERIPIWSQRFEKALSELEYEKALHEWSANTYISRPKKPL